jgi:hypothetical protein
MPWRKSYKLIKRKLLWWLPEILHMHMHMGMLPVELLRIAQAIIAQRVRIHGALESYLKIYTSMVALKLLEVNVCIQDVQAYDVGNSDISW